MGGLDNTTQASSFDPTMTLVRRSTGDKFTFQITQATDGHTTVAELKSALNGISGVDGFEVLAVDDAGDTTYRVTATEEFGDFDIYAGSDPEDATKKTTFEGIAGVQAFTGFQNMSNTGNFYLHNRTTGTSQLFTVTDSIATTNSTNKLRRYRCLPHSWSGRLWRLVYLHVCGHNGRRTNGYCGPGDWGYQRE